MAKTGTNYWTSDRIMHLIIFIASVVLLILLMRYLSKVLLPFFVACLVAYLLQPLVTFNRKLTGSRGRVIPAILTLIDITVIVGLVIYLFLPTVIKDINVLGEIITKVDSGEVETPAYFQSIINMFERFFNTENVKNMLSGQHIMEIINGGSSIIVESVDILIDMLSWLLTIIYILFILIYYPEISRGFKLIVPYKYRDRFLVVFSEVSEKMNRYFRGQGFVALSAMIFYCVGFSIVGLPLAIPMGVLVGFLYMIPYFQYVTAIPVAIICFIYSLGGTVDFGPLLGKCALVYVVSQCICDYLITPHVMGKEMGLNPAVILLALSVWGCLLGIIGMIIALPVTSLIMTYYERYISNPRPSTNSNTAPANENPKSVK